MPATGHLAQDAVAGVLHTAGRIGSETGAVPRGTPI